MKSNEKSLTDESESENEMKDNENLSGEANATGSQMSECGSASDGYESSEG